MVWMNCSRSPPLSLMRAGHDTIIGLRVPPKWLATCLVHWKGVFMACAHEAGKWLKCLGPPQLVQGLEVVLPARGITVEEQILVERALEPAFGARAVVARDIDDERVVSVEERLHGVDDPAHLVVGLRPVGREHFHHARVEALLI